MAVILTGGRFLFWYSNRDSFEYLFPWQNNPLQIPVFVE